MQDIKKRELKMQEKRKNTDWREFVKEICSRQSLLFYKNDGRISRFPKTDRVKGITSYEDFFERNSKEFDYNSDLSFFDNFKKIFQDTNLPALIHYTQNENCNFTDIVMNSKNSYLSSGIIESENVLYCNNIKEHSRNVFNSVMVWQSCENIYFGVGVLKSYNIFYSKFILNSSNIRFSTNLIGCQECLFCSDLQNQSYCISNKVYSKDEYLILKDNLLKDKNKFIEKYLNLGNLGENFGSNNVIGGFCQLSENCKNSFLGFQLKTSNNSILVGGVGINQNVYDVFSAGSGTNNDFYGVTACGAGSQNIYSSAHVVGSSVYYSYIMVNCSYCLGCIGLKNKQFCILNKQYTKEERFELANKIFEKMESDPDGSGKSELGKFFPASMNPFYFNDTVAYLIDDSFTKEEVTKEGYLRRDEEIKVDIPEGSEIVSSSPNPFSFRDGEKTLNDFQGFDTNGNRTINPEILKKVIKDEKGNVYRVVKMEYDFLMKYGLPLPELHRLDRIKLGFKFK